MKPIFIVLSLFILNTVCLNAQPSQKQINRLILSDSTALKNNLSGSDKSLSYEPSLWGLNIYNKGRMPLKNREVRNFLQSDFDMLQKYDKGRRSLIIGDAVIIAGTLTLGYGLFTTVNAYSKEHGFSLDDRALGYSLIGGGALALAGGVLLFFNGQKKMRLAIDAYNDNLSPFVQFGLTPSGLGMLVQF